MRIPAHRLIGATVLLSCGTTAFALGLGNISVQSALGQPLRASIGLLGADSGELTGSCIKVRVESLDGASLVTPQLAITRNGQASSLVLRSRQAIHEPVAAIVVEAGCSASVRRIYQVLFDLPELSASVSSDAPSSRDSGTLSEPAFPKAKTEPAKEEAVAQIVRPARIRSRPEPDAVEKKSVSRKIDSPKPAASAIADNDQSAVRDVLRLTANEDSGISHLKLSSDLTIPPDAPALPLSETARLAQREFAALMRDEDPRFGDAASIKAAQTQETSQRAQMAALQRQNNENKAALADLQATSSLVLWLSGLLVMCLLAIGWLAWRLRSFIKNDNDNAAWWKTSQLDAENQEGAQSSEDQPLAADHDLSGFIGPLPSEHLARSPQDADPRVNAASEAMSSSRTRSAEAALALPEEAENVPQRAGSNEVNVEEISDVTQEAEFWLSLNNPQRAIEILEPHTGIENSDSPVTWLYLLDLYREVGDEEKYNTLRDRFTRLFNARIPLYGEPELQSQTLEDFPHLLSRICKLWQSAEIVPFLQSLLIDDRAGARAGFDLPLYRDILLLIGIALEKKRLNQLDEPHAEIREVASEETPLPVIETIGYSAPVFTEDGAIDFAPLEFNFNVESEIDSAGKQRE